MAYICCRCKNKKEDFSYKNGIRIKTCNRCRLDKKRYSHTDKGLLMYDKAKYKYRHSKKGKEASKRCNRNMYRKWRERVRARAYVYYHKKIGEIKKENCLLCGNIKSQAHHLSYDDRSDIIWVCNKCHWRLHGRGR